MLPNMIQAKKRTKSEVEVVYLENEEKSNLYNGKKYFLRTYGCQMNVHDSEEIKAILENLGYTETEELEDSDIVVLNTICSATEERQMEARQIACEADTMIVIGGRHSSNTQKLYEICRKECKNTYYIQTLVDLDLKTFESIGNVGITAGASTPNNIIEEVQNYVRNEF